MPSIQKPYAESDVRAAEDALIARGPWRPKALAYDVIEAVAPLIAARALREAAHEAPHETHCWLHKRADEIEANA